MHLFVMIPFSFRGNRSSGPRPSSGGGVFASGDLGHHSPVLGRSSRATYRPGGTVPISYIDVNKGIINALVIT